MQADFNHNDFEKSQQRELDKSLLVKFYMAPMKDKHASEAEGRPIFKEIECIDIRVVGKKNGSVARPARHSDIERFPEHYRMFKERIEAPVEGTPLSEWPAIGRSTVETLAFMNIKTVEQLAGMNDSYASQIMGGNGFKAKAKAYLAYATEVKDKTDAAELVQKNKDLQENVDFLTEKLANLIKRVEALDGDKIENAPAKPAKKTPGKQPARKATRKKK